MEDEATLPAANAAGPPDLVAPVKVGASQLEQDSLMTNNPWANLEDGGGEDDGGCVEARPGIHLAQAPVHLTQGAVDWLS